MDSAEVDSIWRAVGACEGTVDEFERRLARVERQSLALAAACFAVGLLLGMVTTAGALLPPSSAIVRR